MLGTPSLFQSSNEIALTKLTRCIAFNPGTSPRHPHMIPPRRDIANSLEQSSTKTWVYQNFYTTGKCNEFDLAFATGIEVGVNPDLSQLNPNMSQFNVFMLSQVGVCRAKKDSQQKSAGSGSGSVNPLFDTKQHKPVPIQHKPVTT